MKSLANFFAAQILYAKNLRFLCDCNPLFYAFVG